MPTIPTSVKSAPGVTTTNSSGFRPFSGNSRMKRLSMVVFTSDELLCSSGTLVVTSTDSRTDPTCSCNFKSTVLPVSISMPLRTSD